MIEPENSLSTVRESYDSVAEDYAEHFRRELADRPLDRALLAAFAELVGGPERGPVADLGCGPGAVTGRLHASGVPVFGVDLSARMLEQARRSCPELRFVQGSMTELPLAEGVLGGIVAWYSIIHVPQERLPAVFAEFHRVLAPGGHVLLAFQEGQQPLQLTEAFGRSISLVFHRRSPRAVEQLLQQAGLERVARQSRAPVEGVERTPQAFLLARKPVVGG
ncbi:MULTISPECIES: class I SAM-dependent DNA methyltransferase [Actinopolyspora]|uniref:Methyltransferase domain-containing protein n=1 Tax=Actinopolyspora saharensis TaxID=995062 RepID=A0A1H0ZLQ1_9ACTN|nr:MULTISPECIES: class I SAM-dependent methyltransferase [Actinopolyspora]NHD15708.1 class I SAM-dependent methyltransferase [Actinopolyspora sp. BKK2]NHE75078.1 class I SAM-dependent methyltransferase [Actinopolyspora sp. BKK1]SDQ28277.1 Methyltransferase domain-containing protein [Actinopolyspora saharensis]